MFFSSCLLQEKREYCNGFVPTIKPKPTEKGIGVRVFLIAILFVVGILIGLFVGYSAGYYAYEREVEDSIILHWKEVYTKPVGGRYGE